MGRSAWDDRIGYMPHVAGLYFGADPCWSPGREFGTEPVLIPVACDLATREVYAVEACATCRSGFGAKVIHPSHPCATCLETGGDDRIRAILERSGLPDSDGEALFALAMLQADIETCRWLRSIEVATDEETKRNVVLVKTTRRLTDAERDGIPADIEGVTITITEPQRGRKAS